VLYFPLITTCKLYWPDRRILLFVREFVHYNITADWNKVSTTLLGRTRPSSRTRHVIGGSLVEDPTTHTRHAWGSPVVDPPHRLHLLHRLCRPHLLLPAGRHETTDHVRDTICVHIGFAVLDEKLSFPLPSRFNYLFTFPTPEYSGAAPLHY
jgi:hypothetical protein